MAFSAVTGRGSALDITSDTTVTLQPTAAIVVGRLAVVCLGTKNVATTDGSTNTHSVTDTEGHVWTKVGEYTETEAGAANDGATISIHVTTVTTELATTDTITATLTSAIADKVLMCFEVTMTSSGVVLQQLGVGQNLMEAAVSGMPSREYLLIGAAAAEGTDAAKTPDADYTELFDTRSRNTGTAVSVHVQARIATLTADTCTSTAWTGTQPIALLAALYETLGCITDTIASGATLTTPTVALAGGVDQFISLP